MTYHALCYKHRCRGGPDAKRKKRLEQLDVRIEKRLGPGVELGQRAGEDERIEQQAGGEERIEQQAGEDERLEQRAGEEERIEQRGETAPLEEEAVGLAAFAQA